jgi:DNA polymerase I-like protein with 3'-5' exonuclease and polymerase domains
MKLKYLTNREQVHSLIESIPEYSLLKVAGFDLETTGLDCHSVKIRTAQLCIGDTVWVLDAFKIKDFNALLKLLLEKLKPLFIIAGHNWVFEIKFLWSIGIDLTGYALFDTYIASSLITSGLSGVEEALDDVSLRYLGIELDKTFQKSDWSVPELSKEQLIYAAKDAWVETLLHPILSKLIIEEDLEEVCKLEHRVMFCIACMEFYGAKVDLDKLAELRPYYENLRDEYTNTFLSFIPNRYIRYDLFDNIYDQGISMSSNQDILKVLQELEVLNPEWLDGDKEKPRLIQSTGADTIKLLDWNDFPILEPLSNIRGVLKLLSSYIYSLPNLVNPITGRLHTSYRAMVSTGRMSSSHPNLQQIPRPQKGKPSVRSCFVPEDGNILVSCDLSQAEIRIIAEVADDEAMLQEFINGLDPYVATAAMISGISYEVMMQMKADGNPKYGELRQKNKAVRLGFNYAMGAGTFRRKARQNYGQIFSLPESKTTRKRYFHGYPGLAQYHESLNDKSITEIRSLAPFRRRRKWHFYPGVPALSNMPIQATCGDWVKYAMALGYERMWLDGYSPTQSQKMKILLNIHDEIVGESELELGEQLCDYIERAMLDAGQTILKKCPIEAEAKILNNLAEK